ncbi:MAG TPA: PKD domain-containing protein [Acidimicrobiales bacterium]|nr:PKD domain-containing protein [Acidimicrobiales bacterium]
MPLVLALAGSILLTADKVATGAPAGTSPLVYVAASSGAGVGQLDAFRVTDVASGTISPVQADNLGGDGAASGLAVTRDSSRALVIANSTAVNNLVAVDTSNGTAGSPLPVVSASAGALDAVAADPANGALAYALTRSGYLLKVNLDTNDVSEVTDVTTTVNSVPSAFSMFAATSLALGDDGTTAYIGADGIYGDDDGEAVLQVPLDTPSPPVTVWAQPAPAFAERAGVVGLALNPTDSEIFGCDRGEVFGLHLPISPTESPFDVVAMPGVQAVTVGPHGKNVYAGLVNANDTAMLEGFPITDSGAVTTATLQSSAFLLADPDEPVRLAVTVNGGSLLVTLSLESDGDPAPFMFYVSLGGGTGPAPTITPGPALALPSDLSDPVALAITPDQAPRASFSASLAVAGALSTFSAAASTVKYGSIASYEWNFGDGSPLITTSGDTATHVFASAGTYTITLVERDSAGTGLPPAFPGTPWAANGPGQTPYRLSSTLARTSQLVTIVAKSHVKPPPKPPKKPPKKPRLTLEPTVGPPGSVVSVVGTGFPDNAVVTIEWSTPNAASTLQKVKVHNGGFTVQLLVLVPDLLGPRQAVALAYPQANRPTFLVVADDEEPGGPNATPVFRSEGP